MWQASILWLFLLHAAPITKEELYLKARELFEQKKDVAATQAFHQLLAIFAREQAQFPRASRSWHQMTLSQIDSLLSLAHIAKRQQKPRLACRFRQRIATHRQSLPAAWTAWMRHTDMPQRVSASQKLLQTKCSKVPSLVRFQLSPPRAQLAWQASSQDRTWHPIPNPATWSTTLTSVSIRASAAGFQTRILKQVQIPRWQTVALSVSLVALPKPLRKPPKPRLSSQSQPAQSPTSRPSSRVIASISPRLPPRMDPLPTPFYKTWWFWTITGVVVAGAASAVIAVAVIPPQWVLSASQPGRPYKLW